MSEDRHKTHKPREYLSGSEKRKRFRDRKERENTDVEKLLLISHFLIPAQTEDGPTRAPDNDDCSTDEPSAPVLVVGKAEDDCPPSSSNIVRIWK